MNCILTFFAKLLRVFGFAKKQQQQKPRVNFIVSVKEKGSSK